MYNKLRPEFTIKTVEGAKMPTAGRYRYGYPEGVVLHYTAGWDRNLQDALNMQKDSAKNGLCFDTVAPKGELIIGAPIDQFGAHAGVSNWPTLGERVSRFLRGIEVVCAGQVNSNKIAWYGGTFTEDDVRELKTTTNDWGPAGFYRKVTDEQFYCVTEYILKLYEESPFRENKKIFSLDLVLGHHEVAGMSGLGRWRKTDIGGSWPMPMGQYRQYLKDLLGI